MEVITRRSRLASRPEPRGQKRKITARDRVWIDLIHDHGPLPTSILTAFTSHLYSPTSDRADVYRADKKDHDAAVKRMKRLFHEAGVFERYAQQYEVAKAERHYLFYGLTDHGRVLSSENSEYSPRINPKIFKHDVMTPCITASIRYAIRETGIQYIPQHKILEKKAKSLVISDVLGHDLVPDGIFGLQYLNGAHRYFFVEADRGTEPQESKHSRKSIRRNYLQYREFIGGGYYKNHFGIDGSAVVLNLTILPDRLVNMVDVVKRASESGRSTFSLYQYTPDFGVNNFEPPHQPLDYLVNLPWKRSGHDPFLITDPPKTIGKVGGGPPAS